MMHTQLSGLFIRSPDAGSNHGKKLLREEHVGGGWGKESSLVAGENEAKMGQPGGVKYEVMLRAHELTQGPGCCWTLEVFEEHPGASR